MAQPQPPLSSYSRSQTLDLRAAMALVLRRKIEALRFSEPAGGEMQFVNVFDSWPSYEERYISPSAAILPGAWTYADARFTPALIEDTWEPVGEVGWGLYRTADIEADFEIIVRAATPAERGIVVQSVENAWVAEEVLMDPVAGARYGVVIDMPEYWGMTAGFSLLSARVLDDPESAMREHREAIFTVRGTSSQVKVAPVRPMRPIVRIDPDC